MSDHQECAHLLCRQEFAPRQNGKKQRFHTPACRRDWDKIKNRIGKKVLKCVIDDILPMLADELYKKNSCDRRGEVSSPREG